MYAKLRSISNHLSVRRIFLRLLAIAAILGAASVYGILHKQQRLEAQASTEVEEQKPAYIRWVDFQVPLAVLEQALEYDLKSHKADEAVKLGWVELLAYTAAKTGGAFKGSGRSTTMDKLVERLRSGEPLASITEGLKYYKYYEEAYNAVLGEFVGEYEVLGEGGKPEQRYGLKVYSPVARGYNYGHSDDFGNPRSYGYRRLHLGNDLMGSIGTPIIAVEGGMVQELGWNRYGGWRIGIRSHDGLRYYYYAHLRKGHPYNKLLQKGDEVYAGDVIGYLGMTGYSTKENVNNIKVPHLHFGLQLIFDASQINGVNQIWIDVYNIVRLLGRNRMPVKQSAEKGEHVRADGYEQGMGGR